MGTLTGESAIVTGASRGIGWAIAERVARDGASVVENCANSPDQAKELVAVMEAGGGKAIAIQADIARIRYLRRIFPDTLPHFGQMDILVNNDAVSFNTLAPVVEVTENEFDVVFGLNARGAFFAMQEAARRLPDCSQIINISTGVAKTRMLEDLFALCPPEMKTILIQRTLMGRLGQPVDVADAAAS